jgi:hypothetical protein
MEDPKLQLSKNDNDKESNKKPVKKKNTNHIENKFVNGLELKFQSIEEDKLKGISIKKYWCCSNEYIGKVKYDDSRMKFQAWVKHQDRVHSLSFFPSAAEAQKNIERYITYINGGMGDLKKVGD